MTGIRAPYKILIVDDNKTFLLAITELLSSTDDQIVIETARSGKECLRKIKNFSPQLILLDIGMDNMNGLVTLRFIKSINSNSLVYLLSGLSEKYLKDAVTMVPADGYFTKTQFVELLTRTHSLKMALDSHSTS